MGNSNRKRLSWAVELLVHKAVYICRSDVQLPACRLISAGSSAVPDWAEEGPLAKPPTQYVYVPRSDSLAGYKGRSQD